MLTRVMSVEFPPNLLCFTNFSFYFLALFNNEIVGNADTDEFSAPLQKLHFQQGNGAILNRKEEQVADHIQFRITEIGPVTPKTPKTPSTKFSKEFDREPPDDFELVAAEPLVSPQIFCQVFPFHLMFDRQMRIVQAGKSVTRVIPKVAEENCPLLDVLEAVRPHIQLSFQTILAHISTIYVLKTKPGTMLEREMVMRLKVK